MAAGGIATGSALAGVLAAGAAAASIGTAFLRCPEAGTTAAHRYAVAQPRRTGLTRAFSGRLARGLVNTFQADHTAAAPIAYPELHHLTTPLRAHARENGDAEQMNLWAGQAHELARDLPAGQLAVELAEDAAAALDRAAHRSVEAEGQMMRHDLTVDQRGMGRQPGRSSSAGVTASHPADGVRLRHAVLSQNCLTEPGERGPIDSHLRIARGRQDHTRQAVSRGPERRTPHEG